MGIAMSAKPVTMVLGCLGSCLFPAIVMVMVMTYEQKTGYGVPGPFPYSAVDYIFVADLFYTMLLILTMKGQRTMTALVSIPLLVLTAVMVFFAGMWFSGNYL